MFVALWNALLFAGLWELEIGMGDYIFIPSYNSSLLCINLSNLNSLLALQISFFIDSLQVHDNFFPSFSVLFFFFCTSFCDGMSRIQGEVVLSIYKMAY